MKHILPFLILLPLATSPIKPAPKQAKATKTRYNLCVFVRFHDEEEHINDNVVNALTRKDIIDNTYNQDEYSMRDYYRCLSSDTLDLKTVYLFPNETGFDSFYLDGNREQYAKKSDTNPNGYELVALAGQQLRSDWASKIQSAIDKGIKPCSLTDRTDTISYEDLDMDQNGTIDSLTVLYSPQEQTHFTTAPQEPLYPCMETNTGISISTSRGTIHSQEYNQWTPNYTSILRKGTSQNYFLPFSTGCHEMGHVFGYRDLYDYHRVIHPVGYMSLMCNCYPTIPQFMTCYEREINSWIDPSHVSTLQGSGTYTINPVRDENQDGICCYKVPIVECPKQWLYIEYRNFTSSTINRYDGRNRDLYNANGTKISTTSGKVGLVCYLVNKDAKYPTNSVGNPKNLGLEVLGGTTTIDNRYDAPRNVVDGTLNVACYDSNGAIKNLNLTIQVDTLDDISATFTINYPGIDNFQEITRDQIGNDAVYDYLNNLSDGPLYNTSFDEDTTFLDLMDMNIDSLDFLNLFNFDKLKYLNLAGNHITDPSVLLPFIQSHPDIKIILDDNEISLSSLPKERLDCTNIYYGLQNTRKNYPILECHINSTFSKGDYSVTYFDSEGGQHSLTNDGYQKLTLIPNTLTHIKSTYFFTDTLYRIHEYDTIYSTTPDVEDPITLSLNGESVITLDYPATYIDQGVTTNYPENLTTVIRKGDDIVSEIAEVGTYVITYTVTRNGETKTVERTVIIKESVPPTLTLKGEETYIGFEYDEPGYLYPEDDTLTLESEIKNQSNQVIPTIQGYGTYQITYTLKKNETICDTKTRTVILLTPEEVIHNPNYSTSFQISKEYYLKNGTKVEEEPTEGDYEIRYIITDNHSHQRTYIEEKSLPITKPEEPDSTSTPISSTTPESESNPSSDTTWTSESSPDSDSTVIRDSVSTSETSHTSDSTESQNPGEENQKTILPYVLLAVFAPLAVAIPLLIVFLNKKK